MEAEVLPRLWKGGEVGMTEKQKAILWLDSFVKCKEPMVLIPKTLIKLI